MTEYPNNDVSRSHATMSQRVVAAALSLQFKATGLVVILALSVAAVVSGYLLRSSEKLAREQRGTQMVQMASMLAKAAAPSFASGDFPAMQKLAADTADGMPLLFVIVTDVDGRQVAAAEDPKAGVLAKLTGSTTRRVSLPGQPVLRSGTKNVPVFLDVTYPITTHVGYARSETGEEGTGLASPTKLLGYVRTGMQEDRWHSTMASRLDLLIGLGILAAVAAIPLGFLLVRRIVSPLDGLAGAMNRFSRGELDVRSAVARKDEIGRLALAFNRMADQHQRTHENIVALNSELEMRVTERTRQLNELASRDPLTGLYNRRAFQELLEQRFSEAKRYETEISCIMLDLDNFKSVNDRFGHQAGDELLILTAKTITQQLRTSDVAARFGGDEFVVLLPQTDADRALVLAERVAEQMREQFQAHLGNAVATASMGIASLPSTSIESAEALVRAADRVLYDAKAAGRDRIVVTSVATPKALI